MTKKRFEELKITIETAIGAYTIGDWVTYHHEESKIDNFIDPIFTSSKEKDIIDTLSDEINDEYNEEFDMKKIHELLTNLYKEVDE